MKVVVIGATGFVGKAILKEASDKGLTVTAIARDVTMAPALPNVTAVAADVNKTEELTAIFKDQDAIISAYNAGWANPNIYDDFIKGSKAIQAAAKAAGVKRLLVIGGAGSLYIGENQLVDSDEFPKEWKPGATAARDYLSSLRQEKELDWTFLSPAIELVPGERTGVFRLGLENPVFDEAGKSKISVEDLAVAVVGEILQPQHIQKRFTLGY
ncbi:hypothetical protein SAMN05192529_11249 [Arachidicoccus rhizosphaerae]|uniref:NAD(P)-binding domain-containing protein n=1 Tax=Arachidicoccus rhizosphaerae TaxID=551991 RepID=A0A1H3ZUS8_9BACT|nr:NAD(P)-dependent oxidoreductase [Arachidicoccus rhizosphaerae]SEA27420.1 hypothetical protein SAMN05192529_11249 [Arachidicoccus rhizosphaerae]